jgi:hypothetical protein
VLLDVGQVSVFGKGGKTRVVLLPTPVWRQTAGQPAPTSRHT